MTGIDARIGLFDVMVCHEEWTRSPDADAWLAGQLDTAQMNLFWRKKGVDETAWHDLKGRWRS